MKYHVTRGPSRHDGVSILTEDDESALLSTLQEYELELMLSTDSFPEAEAAAAILRIHPELTALDKGQSNHG